METTESDVIANLEHIQEKWFAYGLDNGTLGVYNDSTRVWNAQAKYDIMDIAVYDIDNDGQPEIITGWSNGRLEVRCFEDGQLMFKDRFSSPVSGIQIADYRMQGQDEVITCTADGVIRGYCRAATEEAKETIDQKQANFKVEALKAKKMALQLEAMGFERNLKDAKSKTREAGLVPEDTAINMSLEANQSSGKVDIVFTVSSNTLIKLAIVQSKTLIPNGGIMVKKYSKPRSEIRIPLDCHNFNAKSSVVVTCVVGFMSSFQDHVFRDEYVLPQFSYMVQQKDTSHLEKPNSCVKFQMDERAKSITQWINSEFGVELDNVPRASFATWFKSVADNGILVIEYSEGDSDTKGTMKLRTKNMELAGRLVQSLAGTFDIKELASVAEFPEEMKAFQQTMELVEECNVTRLKLQADIADSSNLVKALAIKAEDARLLNNMDAMKRVYAQLYELNLELIGEYKKRANNHAELLRHLKVVNTMIQKSSNLRIGKYKSQVVLECRKAIKSNNIHALVDIFRLGAAS